MAIFFGQEKILQEVRFIVNDIINGSKHNVLLRAASGMGKTTLALKAINMLGGLKNCWYYMPENGTITLNVSVNNHFIDEAHLIISPEFLYPHMDNQRLSFFLMTNESGVLKDPFSNRCIQLYFDQYSPAELALIAGKMFKRQVDKEIINAIVTASNGTPRNVKILCERLRYFFDQYGYPESLDVFYDILSRLDITPDGINRAEKIYLDFLHNVGGQASLSTIAGGTGFDRKLIVEEIEPSLLYRKKIIIGSKGRKICY